MWVFLALGSAFLTAVLGTVTKVGLEKVQPTLALAIGVAAAWARDDERTARRRDRKVEREGDVEMDEYNEMLARLADRDSGHPPEARS